MIGRSSSSTPRRDSFVAIATVSTLLVVAGLTGSACDSDDDAPEAITEGAEGAIGVPGPVEEGSRKKRDAPGPAEMVERYYDLVENRNFDVAWKILPSYVKAESGGYGTWRAGYEATVATDVRTRLRNDSGDSATVAVQIDATDVDACSGRKVDQSFAGTWTLSRDGRAWSAKSIDVAKLSGAAPILDKSECPAAPPASGPPAPPEPPEPPPEQTDCTPGYFPCLSPAPDYDCEGGTGDGPSYTGTVSVTGSDPYGLDADGDGVGCQP